MLVGRFEKLLAAAIVVALVWAGVSAWMQRQPRIVPAGVLITEPGRYPAPVGPLVLELRPEGDGKLKMTTMLVANGKMLGSTSPQPFDQDSPWLICWNATGQLWVYVPANDGNYCHCCYANGLQGMGTRTAGEAGGWDGIPEAFLAQLPENVKRTYETFLASRK